MTGQRLYYTGIEDTGAAVAAVADDVEVVARLWIIEVDAEFRDGCFKYNEHPNGGLVGEACVEVKGSDGGDLGSEVSHRYRGVMEPAFEGDNLVTDSSVIAVVYH